MFVHIISKSLFYNYLEQHKTNTHRWILHLAEVVKSYTMSETESPKSQNVTQVLHLNIDPQTDNKCLFFDQSNVFYSVLVTQLWQDIPI